MIAGHRRLDAQALHRDRDRAGGGAGGRQRDALDHVDAEAIDEAGAFDDRVGRQVGDDAVVADVEMAAIDAAGLQRLDDVAGVLGGALVLARAAWSASSLNFGKSVSNQLRRSVE